MGYRNLIVMPVDIEFAGGTKRHKLKAKSHIPCRAHAVPQRVYIVCFPLDLHSVAVFDSQMPCYALAAPVPCHDHALLKMTSQGHGTAQHWYDTARHGMCELASAVLRGNVIDLPAFGFFRQPRGVPRNLLSEAYKFFKL
jgi:hypothetical protein